MKKNIFIASVIFFAFIFILLYNQPQKQEKDSIRVMAGAGLTEALTAVKDEFEKKYPKMDVELNFAGSQHLAHQIEQGVYADVFISANRKYIDILESKGLVQNPRICAHNMLVVGVSKQAKELREINDLIKHGIKLSIANPAVPVGNYTQVMLGKLQESGLYPADFREKFIKNVISEELSVKAVAIKIALGEVDAGVIYKTDITPENKDKIISVEIDPKYNVIADFIIAELTESGKKEQARDFITFVLSDKGQNILKEYGFMLPNE